MAAESGSAAADDHCLVRLGGSSIGAAEMTIIQHTAAICFFKECGSRADRHWEPFEEDPSDPTKDDIEELKRTCQEKQKAEFVPVHFRHYLANPRNDDDPRLADTIESWTLAVGSEAVPPEDAAYTEKYYYVTSVIKALRPWTSDERDHAMEYFADQLCHDWFENPCDNCQTTNGIWWLGPNDSYPTRKELDMVESRCKCGHAKLPPLRPCCIEDEVRENDGNITLE